MIIFWYYNKFLVLLPLEADENIEVLKHYFGITFDNEFVARGIEIRRHDVPAFIKRFQTQLVYTFFDCKDSSEVLTKGYEDALLLVTQAIDTIMTGEDLDSKALVISKLLRQDIQTKVLRIYFNNHYGGKAVVNALEFKQMIGMPSSEKERKALEKAKHYLSGKLF
jgi:DNA polymerase elongation subunit (family B)